MSGEASQGLFGRLTGDPSAAEKQLVKTRTSTLVVPPGSPVRFAAQDDAFRALFTGTFAMAGSWRFAWVDDETIDLAFTPDPAELENLPYWKSYRQRAEIIDFENPHALLDAVLTHKARTRLRLRRHLAVFGRAVIAVDRFSTQIECNDWPSWRVRFLDVVKPLAPAGHETAPAATA